MRKFIGVLFIIIIFSLFSGCLQQASVPIYRDDDILQKVSKTFVNTRQPFLIGTTQLKHDEVVSNLIKIGYQQTCSMCAWHDYGQIVSMRKLYGKRQVHVRVFNDGEVRMHDEPNFEFDVVEHLIETSYAKQEYINDVVNVLNIRGN